MTLRRESRKAWGAKPPKNRRYDVTPKGVAIHYPGSSGSLRGRSHSDHQAMLRSWQVQHMARGSNDLEYGSLICECGIWMAARTEFSGDRWRVRVGSNGTAAANTTHTSVQLMLGTADRIRQQEKEWLAEAVATLRAEGGWGPQVTGHRDHYPTACPGNSIYNALPEIRRMADRFEETGMAISDKDVERIAGATAARVNRVLGDYNSKGEPIGPNKDDPKVGAVYVRQIRNISEKVLGEVSE